MMPLNENVPAIVIRKQIFITNRSQDIRKYYQFFPKYLGRGGYGIVYRAKMINAPHSQRAVKIVPKLLLKNPQSLINEIQILKRLDHPNIVKLYQTFQDKDNYYLVLDYCEDGQLFYRLSNHGKFSEEHARNIFTQIMKILKYLHTEKIAHRDIKLQNFLMFSKDSFDVRIIDFGLSYRFQENMKEQLKISNKNKILGTSYYIAPQVIQLNYNQKCDIWSSGVVLYILATASPPFDGQTQTQILQNVSKLNYSLSKPECQRLSIELKDLIRRILVREQYRLSIDDILNHPWMTKDKVSQIPLQLNFNKLKQFSEFSKLKTIAVTYIASQLPQKQIHKLGQIFKQIDQNNDGYLTVQQLKQALDKQKQNASLKQLKQILQTIDTDRNGRINYNQFVACCLESSILQNQISFDRDGSGTISKKQFKEILENSNIPSHLVGVFIDQIMRDCDKDNDGEINYLEFLQSIGVKKNTNTNNHIENNNNHTNNHIENNTNTIQNNGNSIESPLLKALSSPNYSAYQTPIISPWCSPWSSPIHSPYRQ